MFMNRCCVKRLGEYGNKLWGADFQCFGNLGSVPRNVVVRLFGILLIGLFIMGCQANTTNNELKGRLTLWHSWTPAEVEVLEGALAQFQEIHPGVRIIPVSMPEEQILSEFSKTGNDGLGPAMLIGKNSWISQLADAGLIRPVSLNQEPDTLTFFNLRNRALVEYQDEIFGVPMSLEPYALYYNKDMVTELPESLDALLAEAADGNGVSFVPRFEEAYWGIQPFGAGLFDATGQFTLAGSGFVEWLRWVAEAQAAPGVILNVDDKSLLELFATGQIAYYVGKPATQARLHALADDQNAIDFGVMPLPQGPNGSSGPLLTAETILLYTYMSDEQAVIANELAKFLVNNQQSIRFMRELDHVPANPAIRVDRRIYPLVNGFARQATTAVVMPNDISSQRLVEAGNRAYITVLSGTDSAETAVCTFGLEVIEILDLSPTEVNLPSGCVPPVEDVEQ